jgi:excisionase family DNA binding protein
VGDPAVTSFVEDHFRDMPEVFGVEELANKLGRTRSTVYRWLNNGDLRLGFRVGKQWVIWKAELIEVFEEMLEENRSRRRAAATVALDDLELPEDDEES